MWEVGHGVNVQILLLLDCRGGSLRPLKGSNSGTGRGALHLKMDQQRVCAYGNKRVMLVFYNDQCFLVVLTNDSSWREQGRVKNILSQASFALTLWVLEQLVVAAPLHHLSARQYADAVRIADGGEAVGHNQAGPSHRQPFQGCLDHSLAGGVQCRGGLVQEQDLKRGQHTRFNVCII